MRSPLMTSLALLGAWSLPAPAIEWQRFDPSPYSQSVTDCDREAAHPVAAQVGLHVDVVDHLGGEDLALAEPCGL